MYFLRRLRPIEVAGERVRELRISLNAPVLATPDLPVGPARAVIVTHREARGGIDVTVGVRALRSGEAVFWSFDGELASVDDLSVAGDAALTFAESLGFLFDEDALGPGSAAANAWNAWVGGDGPASATDEAKLEVAELLLDDELPGVGASTRAPERATAVSKSAPEPSATVRQAAKPPTSASPKLSKFRTRVGSPATKAASSPRLLARIRLVKRRSLEEEHQLLLRKIVTSF